MKYCIIMLILLFLVSCSTLHRTEDIAKKSYQLGCVERGNGSSVDSFNCLKKSEKFDKELHNAWNK